MSANSDDPKKLGNSLGRYCTATLRPFCHLIAQIKASQTSLLYFSVRKLNNILDTFPTPGSPTDAHTLAVWHLLLSMPLSSYVKMKSVILT